MRERRVVPASFQQSVLQLAHSIHCRFIFGAFRLLRLVRSNLDLPPAQNRMATKRQMMLE